MLTDDRFLLQRRRQPFLGPLAENRGEDSLHALEMRGSEPIQGNHQEVEAGLSICDAGEVSGNGEVLDSVPSKHTAFPLRVEL